MTPRWRKTKTKKRAKREGKIFGIATTTKIAYPLLSWQERRL